MLFIYYGQDWNVLERVGVYLVSCVPEGDFTCLLGHWEERNMP